MADIRRLLNQLTIAETQLQSTEFLAPCVKGGQVRIRVSGMVYTFTPKQTRFEGWGIFQPIDDRTATLRETPMLSQVERYLKTMPMLRLRLAYCLQNQTWLAYPINKSDMRQRFKVVKPIVVHLVTEGAAFDQIVVRWNGGSCWFEEIDRRADPKASMTLSDAVRDRVLVTDLKFKGMTPEIRSLYELVINHIPGFTPTDQNRLQKALKQGGGELRQFHDRGDYWNVEWTTTDGTHHTSAIAKADLTVISSGICLSGRDRDFDLQSLVGVIEQQD